MANRAKAIKQAFGVDVPDRLRKFYDNEEAPETELVLEDGFVRGTFEVSFNDDDLLDLPALCENHFIDELEPQHWAEEFASYVPFATLFDANAEEDDEPVKSFLVVDVSNPQCPVLLWDYDGWSLYPLSATLDDFLAGRPTGARTDERRVKSPYKKFRWS